jgi:23S rRNA (adenine2030-N6)-methyltransferase
MNYRHGYHAGNFADAGKHVLLRMLVRALQRKPTPFLFLDTHAGRGRYDLVRPSSASRSPEWPGGIGRLWGRADLPADVADYVSAVRDYNSHAGAGRETLRFYPGSPCLVRMLARPEDRLVLCELEEGERAALGREFSGARRVRVEAMDGYTALRGFLPPPERRALVLIDPPYETKLEIPRLTAALAEGLRRLPGGVFAIWFPLTERVPAADLRDELRVFAAPTLVAEWSGAAGEAGGLEGCGLAVVNPPWKFESEIRPVLQVLSEVLGKGSGAGSRLEWLVPEAGTRPKSGRA